MRKTEFTGQMYRGAGVSGLTGLGLVFSIIFAGVGIMLLGLALVFLLIGLAGQVLVPQTAPGLDEAKERVQATKP